MDLAIDDDLAVVRDTFADFFSRQSAVEVVRGAEPLGFDAELWTRFIKLGGPGIGVPEESGGGGASALALCLVALEAGRRLAPIPLAETFAAAAIAAAVGNEGLLSKVLDGTGIVTLALQHADGDTLRLVPAGAVADIVIGMDGDDLIAWTKPDAVTVDVAPNFAATPIADWDTSLMQRTVLASGASALATYDDGKAAWRLYLSAILDGARRSALEIGVDYVKAREAFGVPIGWFQAVQHRLADVAVAGDGAELLMYEAAWARDEDQPQAHALAAMSLAFNGETAFRTSRESLQFHGGYGYTLEYDIQLYYRRTKAWPLLDGDPRILLANIADDLFARRETEEH